MSKTEICAKILKRKKKFLLSEWHRKLITTRRGWGLSFELNMKQIHEVVQALESHTGFWRPRNTKTPQKILPGEFPMADMDTANI